jgi:HK97 family phage major capsid protein
LCGLPADNSVGIGRSSGEPDDEESELLEDSITQPIEEPGDNPPVEAPPVETQAEVEVENQQEAVEIPAGVEPMPAKMADEEVSEETRNETLETTTPVETVVLEERSLPIDEVIICTDSELLIEPNPELIALRTVALNQKLKTEVEIDQILSRTTDITEARKLLMITEPKTQRVIFQKDNNKMLTNDMITRSLALACKGQFDALEGDARGLIQVTGQRSFSADLFTRTDTFLGDTVVSNMTTGTYGNEGIFQQYIGFLELLRARAVVLAAGAKTRSGSGSMAYVREITATTVVAKAEDSGSPANSNVDFVKVPYLPHALVATVILTDELSKESLVDLQQVLRGDMIKQLALKLDNMAINGVTTPYTVNGLLSSPSAIQNGDLGTPAVPTFAAVNHLKALVDQYAVDLSTCAYICNPLLFALLEATSKGTNLYVPIAADNKINSYKALTSTNLAVNSSFYTLAFGDFSNLEIALMGPTEFMVDIQTRFAEGLTILTARQYVDIGVLQPNGFSKCGNFLLA